MQIEKSKLTVISVFDWCYTIMCVHVCIIIIYVETPQVPVTNLFAHDSMLFKP